MHYTGVPNYLEIITEPMDLGTIRKGMVAHKYETHEQWADDIRKVWANAMHYNAAGSQKASHSPPLPFLGFDGSLSTLATVMQCLLAAALATAVAAAFSRLRQCG
jgi:hypothetical protein